MNGTVVAALDLVGHSLVWWGSTSVAPLPLVAGIVLCVVGLWVIFGCGAVVPGGAVVNTPGTGTTARDVKVSFRTT